MLLRAFGHARFVYNQYISWRQWEYEHAMSGKDTSRSFSYVRSVLTSKNKTTFPWLREVSSIILQEATDQADKAYWQMIANRAKGQPSKLPFRSKRGNQTIRLTRSAMKVRKVNRHWQVYVPKIGWIHAKTRSNIAQASSVTIKLDKTGRYFASFVIEAKPKPSTTPGKVCGIDVGITSFATIVTSDATRTKIANPRFYQARQRKLARAQKQLSRAKKGSQNRRKLKTKLARIHAKTANMRNDYCHQLSSTITSDNQVVCLETLNIGQLNRTRLAKKIYDAAWAEFIVQLEYKTQLKGGKVAYAPQFYPSSKTCSICGWVNKNLTLAQRQWTCQECGHQLDRDYNAAINIIDAAGHGESLNACGEDVRHQLASADLNETRTHQNHQQPGKNRKILAVNAASGSRKPRP